MSANQITNSRRIPTDAELDSARATMRDVPVGQRLTDEQAKAQALLSQCGPACQCGDCPTAPFEIWSDNPQGLIGYVTRLDYPAGKWAAMFPDHDDVMHDPQPVKRWSDPLDSFEAAEAQVRTNFSTWLRRQG